jgi:hypothetical protein
MADSPFSFGEGADGIPGAGKRFSTAVIACSRCRGMIFFSDYADAKKDKRMALALRAGGDYFHSGYAPSGADCARPDRE